MDFPDDLYYTEEHEWLRVEDGNVAAVGITDFAQSELGDIVFVEIDPEGTEVDQDGVFGTVEAVKTVSELYMPVSGTITAINTELESAPETVNNDPYGDGWMVKIEMADPSELDGLMRADDYSELV
ncbi:MAG: glycine cleavage system protein GcvH [Bacteroidetes bacterium]|jgi:glycine cleavage system H protein|nr:glycine cleavage system protein GcvH [Bacteroidota bacterium]